MADTLYQHSDNKFTTSITKSGVTQPASEFSDAEYIIARPSGEILITKRLGSGIEVSGDQFVTSIDDGEITFRGNGFVHQFVVYDALGNRLPPVFNNKLSIKSTIKGS